MKTYVQMIDREANSSYKGLFIPKREAYNIKLSYAHQMHKLVQQSRTLRTISLN